MRSYFIMFVLVKILVVLFIDSSATGFLTTQDSSQFNLGIQMCLYTDCHRIKYFKIANFK